MKRRILLLRLDAIGDFVLFTSVLPSLRNQYAEDHLTLVVHPVVNPIALGCPYVDEVWSIDPDRYTIDMTYVHEVTQRVSGKFDVAINTMYTRTEVSDNIIARTHAPVKIGFECNDRDDRQLSRQSDQVLYTHLISTHAEKMFELERYRLFLHSLGITIEAAQIKPQFWIRDDTRRSVQSMLANELSGKRTYAVMGPGAAFDAKYWSSSAFAEIADYLVETRQFAVVIAGSEKDKPLAEAIMGKMKSDAVDMTGRFTLPQFAALIEQSRLYVGIDSAGFHFAWSLGVPTVGIFGGGHFGRFTLERSNVQIVNFPMECYYCYWHCIYDEIKCITSITPKMVADAIKRLDFTEKESVR